jgi:hypothetical protein
MALGINGWLGESMAGSGINGWLWNQWMAVESLDGIGSQRMALES